MKKYETIIIQNSKDLKQPTIYYFLKTLGFSENYIKNLRKNPEGILLNGKKVIIREKIVDGNILQILSSPNFASQIAECNGVLDILYEDEDYLIVNKPHNLATTPTRSHYPLNLGGQICKYMNQKDDSFVLRIANRLDKETAGIVITAKNVPAYNNLTVNKEYHALCHGKITENYTISQPIKTVTNNGINQMKRIVANDGQTAVTHVSPIKILDQYSLISLKLETGRTHQIRVHLSSINHPLLGDSIYGTEDKFPHTMLILKKIEFTHFRSKEKIKIEIPYPEIWNKKDLPL